MIYMSFKWFIITLDLSSYKKKKYLAKPVHVYIHTNEHQEINNGYFAMIML